MLAEIALSRKRTFSVFTVILFGFLKATDGAVTSTCSSTPIWLVAEKEYNSIVTDEYIRGSSRCIWTIRSGRCSTGIRVEFENLRDFNYADEITVYNGPSTAYASIWTFRRNYHSTTISHSSLSKTFVTIKVGNIDTWRYQNFRRRLTIRYREEKIGVNTRPIAVFGVPPYPVTTRTCNPTSNLIAYANPHKILSPGYPNKYSNSLACQWLILSNDPCDRTPIQIIIHNLSLENGYDFLVIHNGSSRTDPILARLTGSVEPQIILSNTTSVLISFTTDQKTTGTGFRLSYTKARVTPAFQRGENSTLNNETAEISIDVVSTSPCQSIYWSKGGNVLQDDHKYSVSTAAIQVPNEIEESISMDALRIILRVSDIDLHDFGMYKMSVRNERGIFEGAVFLDRPKSAPIFHNYSATSYPATISVVFSSDPLYQDIKWKKMQTLVESGDNILITTTEIGLVTEGYKKYVKCLSTIEIVSPIEADYGSYRIEVTNAEGTSSLEIQLDFPTSELPRIVSIPNVGVLDETIKLEVHFESKLTNPSVTWYKEDIPLNPSDTYSIILTGGSYTSRSGNTDLTLGQGSNELEEAATYKASLIISNLTALDFGLYKVSLANRAGIVTQLIYVKIPEVFPSIRSCDQYDTVSFTCNVSICSTIFHSWIHSVNGNVIRTIPGQQNNGVNTLTIAACMFEDAGTYRCVVEGDELNTAEHSDVNLTSSLRYEVKLDIKAVPVFGNVTSQASRSRIFISVPFYSHPNVQQIHWELNNVRLVSSSSKINIERNQAKVQLTVHGTVMEYDGHVATLSVRRPSTANFGKYKISVQNEIGFSEFSMQVTNPNYGTPVISTDVTTVVVDDTASFNVTFTSYPLHNSIKWYRGDEELKAGDKYTKVTTPSNVEIGENGHDGITFATRFSINLSSLKDFGKYAVVINNAVGSATLPIMLEHPKADVPSIHIMMTQIRNNTGQISAAFDSFPAYHTVKWFKGETQLRNDAVYSIATEETNTNVIAGSRFGFISRVTMNTIDDDSYGLYSVWVYNEKGLAKRSIRLQRECQEV